MKDDYIKRSAALACCGEYLPGADLIAKDIRKIPADEDVVKVVRCKDCAWFSHPEGLERKDAGFCEAHGIYFLDNFYCMMGSMYYCTIIREGVEDKRYNKDKPRRKEDTNEPVT